MEFLNGLRGLVLAKEVDLARAEAAIDVFGKFPLRRLAHDVVGHRVWELRGNLTAYDAAYVALAELWDCPLVTCDAPLANAPGNDATIELF